MQAPVRPSPLLEALAAALREIEEREAAERVERRRKMRVVSARTVEAA